MWTLKAIPKGSLKMKALQRYLQPALALLWHIIGIEGFQIRAVPGHHTKTLGVQGYGILLISSLTPAEQLRSVSYAAGGPASRGCQVAAFNDPLLPKGKHPNLLLDWERVQSMGVELVSALKP